MTILRAAAVQASSVWLDKSSTTKKVISFLSEAYEKKVELIAFPEAFLSGYPFWVCRTNGAKWNDPKQKKAYSQYLGAAVEIDSPEMRMITEAARDFGIFVYLSITERGAGEARGTIFCNLVAISPEAGIVGNHRKLMPTFDERLVWGIGDGYGLEVHDVKGAKVGGLNCWENWLPLARFALYAGGEDIHISVWPGADSEVTNIGKTISKEGRVWAISASGILSIDDIPSSFALYDELRESGATNFFNGGSAIMDPCGNYVVGPILDKEQLLIADLDLDIVRQERQNFDVSGHYARPDVFNFTVNRKRLHRVRFIDSVPGEISDPGEKPN